jgi:hypothetical protein
MFQIIIEKIKRNKNFAVQKSLCPYSHITMNFNKIKTRFIISNKT